MSFEILHKDLMARIGRFHTRAGVIETPALLPVVNPNKMLISMEQLSQLGIQAIIVNAYSIFRSQLEIAELHRFLGWNRPIMTDSGAYQLLQYGDLEVDNDQILRFQLQLGSDIIVPLDIPTPPDASLERASAEWEQSLARIKQALRIKSDRALCCPIQGSCYPQLRAQAAASVSDLDVDLYAIGGVVPLLEQYRYPELIKLIAAVKSSLPPSKPVHLFGTGHPMSFSFSVSLGCDLFDSAAYALYAMDGRYLSSERTYKLEDLEYLPCCCPVCSRRTPSDLDPELLALHNLWVSIQELKTIKQAIREGTLFELLQRRARAHPALYAGLLELLNHAQLMEKFDPITKPRFLYLGPESCRRSEVLRHRAKLSKLKLSGRILVTPLPECTPRGYDSVLGFKPVFGPYLREWEESYPIGQSELVLDPDSRRAALESLLELIRANPQAQFELAYTAEWEDPLLAQLGKYARLIKIEEPTSG